MRVSSASHRATVLALLCHGCLAPPSPGAVVAASAPSVAIDVVGDGRVECVLGVEQHACSADGGRQCLRAADAASWRALREHYGGALRGLAAAHVSFAVEQVVAVPLGVGVDVERLVVSSEEGVDVVTVDVATAHAAIRPSRREGAAPRRALLLRVDPFAPQLAIVVRDRRAGMERTLAVFSP